MYTNDIHQTLINEFNWPGHVEKSTGSTGWAQGRTHDPVTAITAASETNQAPIFRDENTGTKGLCDDCATALVDTAGDHPGGGWGGESGRSNRWEFGGFLSR